jgi:hypothetical protein
LGEELVVSVASIAEIRAKETGRIEAFSDGIFAFAITLLALYLKAPDPSEGNLLLGLAAQWPSSSPWGRGPRGSPWPSCLCSSACLMRVVL